MTFQESISHGIISSKTEDVALCPSLSPYYRTAKKDVQVTHERNPGHNIEVKDGTSGKGRDGVVPKEFRVCAAKPKNSILAKSQSSSLATAVASSNAGDGVSTNVRRKRSICHEDDAANPLSKRANTLSIKRSFDILNRKVDAYQIIRAGQPKASLNVFSCGLNQGKYAEECSQEVKHSLIMIARHMLRKSLPPKKRFLAQQHSM